MPCCAARSVCPPDAPVPALLSLYHNSQRPRLEELRCMVVVSVHDLLHQGRITRRTRLLCSRRPGTGQGEQGWSRRGQGPGTDPRPGLHGHADTATRAPTAPEAGPKPKPGVSRHNHHTWSPTPGKKSLAASHQSTHCHQGGGTEPRTPAF